MTRLINNLVSQRSTTELTIISNEVGKARYEVMNGRQFIVAPLTLIVSGVLNGSGGALYYPPDEVEKDPTIWNGFPIVVYHPTEYGKPISARDPDVFNKSHVGFVFHAKGVKGKLKAEGWFDVELTKAVDERVYKSLEVGDPIELSTGLFADFVPAEEGAVHNGKAYDYIATNYRPDHLAVLPDQTGACSLKDGCGVLVNSTATSFSSETEGWQPVGSILLNNIDMAYHEIEDNVRKALYEARPTVYDSSGMSKSYCYLVSVYNDYLIYSSDGDLYKMPYEMDKKGRVTLDEKNEEPVRKVVSYVAVNNSSTDTPTLLEKPMAKLTAEERTGIIQSLAANCDCWKDAEGQELLGNFSDEKLIKLKEKSERDRQMAAIANAAVRGIRDGDKELHINPETGQWEGKRVSNTSATKAESDTRTEPKPEPKQVENKDVKPEATKKAPQSVEDVIRSLPSAIRDQFESTFRVAQQVENRERDKLIAEILVNVAEGERPLQREWLQQQSVEYLQRMQSIMPKAPTKEDLNKLSTPTTNRTVQRQDEDMLSMPTLSWGNDGKDNAGGKATVTNSSPAADDIGGYEEDELNKLSPATRARIQNALIIEERERQKLIEEITVNVFDEDQQRRLTGILSRKSLDELKVLASIPSVKGSGAGRNGVNNYFGSAAPANGGRSVDANEDLLPVPHMNWGENGRN